MFITTRYNIITYFFYEVKKKYTKRGKKVLDKLRLRVYNIIELTKRGSKFNKIERK